MPETEGTRVRNRLKLAYIIEQYDRVHGNDGSQYTEPHLIADWAVENGLFVRPPVTPQEHLRKLLSRHLRNEHTKDPQGREVRRYHAVVYEQDTEDGPKRRSRWAQIFTATANHMRASLQIRRKSAVSDVFQLDIDFQSYNENNVHGAKLAPMDFDFNKDLEELKQSANYPDGPEGDDLEDEDGDPV